MEVEDGEDGISAGRMEGGDDAPAAHARPSEHAAAPARPATADAIKENRFRFLREQKGVMLVCGAWLGGALRADTAEAGGCA